MKAFPKTDLEFVRRHHLCDVLDPPPRRPMKPSEAVAVVLVGIASAAIAVGAVLFIFG